MSLSAENPDPEFRGSQRILTFMGKYNKGRFLADLKAFLIGMKYGTYLM